MVTTNTEFCLRHCSNIIQRETISFIQVDQNIKLLVNKVPDLKRIWNHVPFQILPRKKIKTKLCKLRNRQLFFIYVTQRKYFFMVTADGFNVLLYHLVILLVSSIIKHSYFFCLRKAYHLLVLARLAHLLQEYGVTY